MKRTIERFERGVLGMIIAGLLMVVAARPAAAQWGASTYGVAEYDTDQTLLLLAGLSMGPRGMGVQPRIGVQAYNLSFDAGTTRTSVFSVKPFVGITNSMADGEVYGSVGYAFTNKKNVSAAATSVGESGEGVVVAGGWQTYGQSNPLAYQALASYNFKSEAIWARGRATGKLSTNGARSTRLGGELAFFNQNTSVWQPGAILEFHSGASVFGLGAGMKFLEGGNNVYFKVEGSMPLGR